MGEKSVYSPDLFALVLDEDWVALADMLQKTSHSSEDSSILLERYGLDEPEPCTQQSSLLHVAVSFPSVPVSIVETLLHQTPSLAYSCDVFGRTPLHIAANYSFRPDVVGTLVRITPETALQQDESLLRPIDYLSQKILMREERSKYVKNNATKKSNQRSQETTLLWDCVQPLAVALDPSGIRDWESPMLHACLRARDFPYALLERAMKFYKDDFEKADQFGNYPLHVVSGLSSDEDPKDNFLTSVAQHYKKAAKLRNHQEKLPLDLAIESGLRGWDTGIAELLEIYPAPENFSIPLSVYLLALASRQDRKAMLFEMLRNQPEFFTYMQSETT